MVHAWAQVPKTVSFQGFLTNSTGDPLTVSSDMRFSLHDALTGGAELWFDDYTGVTVTKGIYNVVLGDKKPIILAFDKPYFLQVKVGSEVLAPRLTLTSSPYSLSAINASNITSGSISAAIIPDGIVTNTKLGVNSISNDKIQDNAVDGPAILDNSVGTEDIKDATITTNDVSVIAGSKITPGFGAQNISTTGTLSVGAITGTTISGTTFTGNGAGLTNLDATKLTGGTANRVAFWGASGISSNAAFIWDNTNNRMGVGTTPLVPLHVDANAGNETIRLEANTTPTITFYESATQRGFVQASAGDMYVGTTGASNSLILMANGNIGFTMNSARLVGLSRSPVTNRLEINGEASKTTAGSWIANSDRRIKTNIEDIPNALSIISNLHPVKFRYTTAWRNRNPDIKDRYYYNYIAQEYREVFPDAVKGSGEFLEGDATEILQIDTYDTQIVLVKAVQELLTRVEKLESENLQLKKQLGVAGPLKAEVAIQKP